MEQVKKKGRSSFFLFTQFNAHAIFERRSLTAPPAPMREPSSDIGYSNSQAGDRQTAAADGKRE